MCSAAVRWLPASRVYRQPPDRDGSISPPGSLGQQKRWCLDRPVALSLGPRRFGIHREGCTVFHGHCDLVFSPDLTATRGWRFNSHRPWSIGRWLLAMWACSNLAYAQSAIESHSLIAHQAVVNDRSPAATAAPVVPTDSQLDWLLDIALSRHPQLAEASAGVRRESGLRFQSTRKPNPSLGYAASEIGNDGRSGQQGLYVAQEWVTAGKLDMAGQAGHWKTRAALKRLAQSRLRLGLRVQLQYWSMLAARQRLALLHQIEQLLAEAVDVNHRLLQAAEINRGTLLQARLEQQQIVVALRQARIDLQARTQALATTLAVAPDWLERLPDDSWPTDKPAQGQLASNEAPAHSMTDWQGDAPIGWLTAEAWRGSPELSEVAAMIEAARWELRLAQVQIASNLDSYASLQHDAISNNIIVGLQVGLALPVHDRKSGLVAAAQATVAEYQAQLERRNRELQTRWIMAMNEFSTAHAMVRSVDGELLQLAQERFELARQAHQQGEIDYLELLTAQRSYLSIQQAALDAKERAALALARLECFAIDEN